MNDFFVSTDAPLGEYEVILNKITIDYCTPDEDYDNIPETKTSTHDLACKENFALV